MRLRQIAENITPDLFFNEIGSLTFIYTADNGLIWSDDEEQTHEEIMMNNDHYFGISPKPYLDLDDPDYDLQDDEIMDEWEDETAAIRRNLEAHGLVGRVSPDKRYVSFWNDPTNTHGLLNDCLNELFNKNFIKSETYVVLFGSKRKVQAGIALTTRDIQAQDTRVDPKKARELELLRNLHLMNPQAKKKAKKELGLAWSSRKHPWQSASEKARLVTPDQKWWAPTSESKG